jgi:trk system potassium uptake protein TrkH
VWTSIFHSISAFNNAGFDIFGSFRSLLNYQSIPQVTLTAAALIFLGGISYLVVFDMLRSRKWGRLSLDTKIALATTVCLLAFGMVIILFTEWNNPDTFGAISYPQRVLNAFFQSVTARTAGFSTIDMAAVANYTLFVIMLLMFVGGASGSTAGGVKVNTFGILVSTIWSTIKGRENAIAFGRRFSAQQIYRALTLVIFSLGFLSLVVFILTVTEDLKFIDLLFESFSAFGTVGLSAGITPNLSMAGRIIITITMFVGRLGPLTLVLALIQRQQATTFRYPEEIVRIG